MLGLQREAGSEQRAQALRGIAGAQVPVFLVRLAEGVAQPPQRAVLEVGRVDDEEPAGPRDAGQLGREAPVVHDVLEHVHHDHAIELRVREGQALAVRRWTSVPTSSRMEATASSVRSAEAQRPPRGAAGG